MPNRLDVGDNASFWAEFTDLAAASREQIALFVASAEAGGHRAFDRIAVQTPGRALRA